MCIRDSEPAWILRSLSGLGQLTTRMVVPDLPDWRQMDLRIPLLSWEMTLMTDADETTVRAIFEFVEGLCDHDIRPLAADGEAAKAVNAPADARPAPTIPDASPQAEGRAGSMPPRAPDPTAPDPTTPDPAAPDEPGRGTAPDRTAAPGISKPVETHAASQTLRVELDRVDRLINSVGELITNHAAIAQRIDEMALPSGAEIKTHVEDYRLLARDIQEAVMAIRAQPVKPLFQRMARIVREAADATGKVAHMVTAGENVEVDKTVIERLADPLTHMLSLIHI